jgi:predicted nucleotidyltransferase component of viral defense system
MRDVALQIARESKGRQRLVLREYLQNYILFRYSEDLDFSAKKEWMNSNHKIFQDKMFRELERAGYDLTIKLKIDSTLHRIMIRFAGLLYELGLSGRQNENISINVEVDTNPPLGWKEEITVVNIHLPVLIRHYDLSSAFAGKLAAILLRPYTKGRDIFDLFWFRSRWNDLKPNLILLNNALKQQRSALPPLSESYWLEVIRNKIESLDWRNVEEDVLPFLEAEDDILVFSRDAVMTALK